MAVLDELGGFWQLRLSADTTLLLRQQLHVISKV